MEQNPELVRTLEQIGLSPKEAQVYLALLALESSTAYEIAQHCEVKKPTVYVILEDLRQKGLVLKVPHAKKALFAAKDISEYLAEQRGKLNAVQSMLPRLQSLSSTNKPKVYFFNGMRGMTEAMDYKLDSMRGKTFCSFYGNSAEADQRVIQLYRRWTPDAIAANISFKIVMPQNQSLSENYPDLRRRSEEKDHVEIKYLSEYTQDTNLSIEIAETFVRIDDAKNLAVTIIDDKATADAMRQIFAIVWQKGV
jgi:sugar-specific transcriptional regulator TrmB